MKIYKAKTLFQGYKIGAMNADMYVGVPGGQDYPSEENFKKEKNFIVVHDGKEMKIRDWNKALFKHQFDDLKGRGKYWLAYFKWNPKEDEVVVSAFSAMASMPEKMKEEIKIKLGIKT